MEDQKSKPPQDTIDGAGQEQVFPVYANNVRFEMTAWDLRILFGQLGAASQGRGQVDWHTDVTMPWAQAKLMHFYLGMNIALFERENGQIRIPASVLPAPITTLPEGVDASNPNAVSTFEFVQDLIRAFRDGQLTK